VAAGPRAASRVKVLKSNRRTTCRRGLRARKGASRLYILLRWSLDLKEAKVLLDELQA